MGGRLGGRIEMELTLTVLALLIQKAYMGARGLLQ
jgi:hypothetical protein